MAEPGPDDPQVLFGDARPRHRPSTPLPAGHVVFDNLGSGDTPVVWLTDDPPPAGLWASLRAEHRDTGLWPLLLDGGSVDDAQPWPVGDRVRGGRVAQSAEALMARWWEAYTAPDGTDVLSDDERVAVTAPFGRVWPGLTPQLPPAGDADLGADAYAEELLRRRPALRLGLVAADHGADALAAAGWLGAVNYVESTDELGVVLRDWADRFGARVVGVGFAEVYLSVAAPPITRDEAIRVAAEHFAFCPDNIWQLDEPFTLEGYAYRLVGATAWTFWWD